MHALVHPTYSRDGFILLMLGCGLIVFFILLQTVAAQYAGSLTGYEMCYIRLVNWLKGVSF